MKPTTPHDNDEQEDDEEPEQMSEKDKTMERIRLLRADGVTFSSYDSADPEYSVFNTRGGLRSSGKFGRG